MERHPVPQNIMEVEFKLFGSLTIKQFGYLALGCLVAVLIYFSPVIDLIKYPLVAIAGIMGLFLAVGQINGITSTVWLSNFIVAMFSSQERVWKKMAVTPEVLKETLIDTRKPQDDIGIVRKVNPAALLRDMPLMPDVSESETAYDINLEDKLKSIDSHFNFLYRDLPNNYNAQIQQPVVTPTIPKPTQVQRKPVNTPPTVAVDKDRLNLAGASQYHSQIYKQFEPSDYKQGPSIVSNNLQPNLINQVMNEKDMEENLGVNSINISHIGVVQPVAQYVNLVKGLVVDKKQEPVSNALIYVKDANEILVRKAMTNAQGLFALTTPLQNGEYFIDVEARGCKFPRFKVLLDGKQLPGYKFTEK